MTFYSRLTENDRSATDYTCSCSCLWSDGIIVF